MDETPIQITNRNPPIPPLLTNTTNSDDPASPGTSSARRGSSDTDTQDGTQWLFCQAATLLQLVCETRTLQQFKGTKKTHAHIWIKLAETLNEKHNTTFTWQQVRNKFNHLKVDYMTRLRRFDSSYLRTDNTSSGNAPRTNSQCNGRKIVYILHGL